MHTNLLEYCKEIISLNENLLNNHPFSIPQYKYKKYYVSIEHKEAETLFIFYDYKIRNYKVSYINYKNKVIDNCFVCLEETHTKSNCCGQSICIDCIEKWKNKDANFTYKCPYCRRVFDKMGYQKNEITNIYIRITKEMRDDIKKQRLDILNALKLKSKRIFCC